MTVLHVSAYFAPAFGFGGPPRSLLGLCHAQRESGIDVHVFTTTANVGDPLPSHPDGIDVDGLRVAYFPQTGPRILMGARAMAAALPARVAAVDVVHVHGLFNRTVWMGAAAARRAGVPYVVSPRGMLEAAALAHHAGRKRVAWAAFDRRVMAGAACWHATSPREAEALRGRASPRPVVDIPNCVETPAIDPRQPDDARAAFGIPAGAPLVVFLGRLHPIKRLDLLARVFDRLSATVPGVHLALAGPDERGHRARIEPLYARGGGRVHWCGQVNDGVKWGLLGTASALIMCSDSESFGMSVAEALAASTPVVVSQTCPWAIVEAEGCGRWVAQSPQALADALADLLSRPDEARAMGRRGRALVERRFSAVAVGRKWADVYQTLR